MIDRRALRENFCQQRDLTPINREMLQTTFTHSSLGGTDKNNERLEFIGDSVLGCCVAEILFQSFPSENEAELTLRKISLIKEPTLAIVARKIWLDQLLLLSHGEEKNGGREKASILSDTMEAVLGYIFLNFGYQKSRDCISQRIMTELDLDLESYKSFKSRLQEFVQKHHKTLPKYQEKSQKSSTGESEFLCEVFVHGQLRGAGTGKNKKEAQESAAEVAFDGHCRDDSTTQKKSPKKITKKSPQKIPAKISDKNSEKSPEKSSEKKPEKSWLLSKLFKPKKSEKNSEKTSEKNSEKISEKTPQKLWTKIWKKTSPPPQKSPKNQPENTPKKIFPKNAPDKTTGKITGKTTEKISAKSWQNATTKSTHAGPTTPRRRTNTQNSARPTTNSRRKSPSRLDNSPPKTRTRPRPRRAAKSQDF